MKKAIIIAIICAVLAGGGVAAYFGLSGNDDKDSGKDNDKEKESVSSEYESGSSDIGDGVTEDKPVGGEAAVVDYVTDSKVLVRSDGYRLLCYHIPDIKAAGAKSLNEKLDDIYSAKFRNAEEENCGGVEYRYEIKSNILALLMIESGYNYDKCDMTVYYFDIIEGKEVTAESLLELYSLTNEQYIDSLKTFINNYGIANGWDEKQDGTMIEVALSEENLSQAQPYPGENGELLSTVFFFGDAGVGFYDFLADTKNEELILSFPVCSEDHFDDAYSSYSEEEAEAAAMYTEFLNNGGHREITENSTVENYGYIVKSKLIDVFGDTSPELIISYEKNEYSTPGAMYSSAVLTIAGGKVVIVDRAVHYGGSGGGTTIDLLYDKANDAPAVVKDEMARVGYMYSSVFTDVYTSDYKSTDSTVTYEMAYIYVEDLSAEDVEKVKAETDKWEEEGSEFKYYKADGEYITSEEYYGYIERFTMKDGYSLEPASLTFPVHSDKLS